MPAPARVSPHTPAPMDCNNVCKTILTRPQLVAALPIERALQGERAGGGERVQGC